MKPPLLAFSMLEAGGIQCEVAELGGGQLNGLPIMGNPIEGLECGLIALLDPLV